MTGSAVYLPAAVCLAAAGLESVCAGRGIKNRMAELRTPRWAPPMSVWVVIGGLYYVICFAVLYRLFQRPANIAPRTFAIALVLSVMVTNAAWNWFFFRTRKLSLAFAISIGYTLLTLVLLGLLFRVDSPAAAFLAPYVAYLSYANAWGYALWKLNPDDA